MDEISNAKFDRNPDGYIIIDGYEVAHTKQCAHCGSHFISVKGSGKVRGWCFKCNHILCGRQECLPCIPWQQKLEIEEKKEVVK